MTESMLGTNVYQVRSTEQTTILVDSLSMIRAEARQIKGDQIRIGAITYPTHFGPDLLEVTFNAAQKLDPNFNAVIRLRPSYYSAMVTYPEDYCSKTLFQDAGSVEDDDPVVLLLEVAFNQLHIIPARVGVPGTSTESTRSINWPADVETVSSALQNSSVQSLLTEIVSVIFTGEDAETDFSHVRAALRKIDSSLLRRVQIPALGFEYVSAVGAACVARQLAIFPERLEPLDPPYELHDEL